MFYDESGFHFWRFLVFLLLVCGLTLGIACAALAESPERDPPEVVDQQEESVDLYEPEQAETVTAGAVIAELQGIRQTQDILVFGIIPAIMAFILVWKGLYWIFDRYVWI